MHCWLSEWRWTKTAIVRPFFMSLPHKADEWLFFPRWQWTALKHFAKKLKYQPHGVTRRNQGITEIICVHRLRWLIVGSNFHGNPFWDISDWAKHINKWLCGWNCNILKMYLNLLLIYAEFRLIENTTHFRKMLSMGVCSERPRGLQL